VDWIAIGALIPLVGMVWLMLIGAIMVWWRLVISPGVKDGFR
jgi:hypothetical protein